MASVLCNKHILVRFVSGANFWLRLEDCHLRNLLVDTTTITRLEALIDVPVEQVSLVATSEEKVVHSRHTERNLVLGVQVCNQAQVFRGQDV